MKKLIVANWKMNPASLAEAKRLLHSLNRGLRKKTKAEVVVCPPFVYLPLCLGVYPHTRKAKLFGVGAQDCFWEEKGAFTGEISPAMLRDLRVQYVIVGHSERRQLVGEDDEIVNQKLRAVLKANLRPILCIGETGEERKRGTAFKVLEKEIREGLKKVPKSQIERIVIAYEPIWAIGTKNPCSPDNALTASLFTRKIIGRFLSKKAARNIRILYGGSVDSQNAQDYLNSEWLNGLLVGGTSLRPQEFLKIIDSACDPHKFA